MLAAPEEPGGRERHSPPWRIGVIAAVVLILELTFLRQVPAEVRAIAYFTNLLLMASFFGLGLGCILARARSLEPLLPIGVALVAGYVAVARGIVIYAGSDAVHYWLGGHGPLPGAATRVPLLPAAVLAFLVTALPFVALGQALARAMAEERRLAAYSWDIAGSLAGTVLFSATAYLSLPPWVWPPAVMTVWAVVFTRGRLRRLGVILSGVVFLLFSQSPQAWRWSPYYFVQYRQEEGGLRVWVNSSFHQFAVDFAATGARIAPIQRRILAKFAAPYDLYRAHHGGRSPGRVLILGAGTGNDVHVALANGAGDVLAVEIDPVILELGRRANPARPYDDRRVRTSVDDARHFLRSSAESFDLVVLGTLDSQTLLSGQSNLRLDNYVYTREAFEDVKRRLVPGGMMAAYYSVLKPWLYGRIYATVHAAFGDSMTMLRFESAALFDTAIVAAAAPTSLRADPAVAARYRDDVASTDDWPYIYLERPTVAPLYLEILAVILGLAAAVLWRLRRAHPGSAARHASFLFLGMGFTLLESAAIVRLGLVFGCTWIVNAVVFASVLLTIFVANAMVLRGIAPSLRVSWVGLLAAVLANYLLPLPWLLLLPAAERVIASGLFIGIPIYFAAIAFSRLFEREPAPGLPLGVNLVGAMVGGTLEYLSMWIGMRAVWLVLAGVYLLAYLSTARGAATSRSAAAIER
jgi:hypothetical protein